MAAAHLQTVAAIRAQYGMCIVGGGAKGGGGAFSEPEDWEAAAAAEAMTSLLSPGPNDVTLDDVTALSSECVCPFSPQEHLR